MERTDPPIIKLFQEPLEALDLYQGGALCIETPVSLIPIIVGALHELQYPHAWKGEQDKIATALLQINDFIGAWGEIDTLCQNGEITPPPVDNGAGGGGSGNGACGMNCSIPYGAMRWNGENLEYKYCGEWYAVEGERTYPDWEDPGEDETDPPEERENATSCSKTLAWCGVVFSTIGILLQYSVDDLNPFDALSEVKAAHPTINWGTLDLFSAYMSALKIALVAKEDDAQDSDIQQKMVCSVVQYIAENDNGMTPDEYLAAKQAMYAVADDEFTFAEWTILDVEVKNLYRKVSRAIGQNDSRKLTTMILPAPEDNCGCPGSEPSATVYFNGVVTDSGSVGGVLGAISRDLGSRRISIQGQFSAGQWRVLNEVKTYMDGDLASVTSLTVRQYPLHIGIQNFNNEWVAEGEDEVSDWCHFILSGPAMAYDLDRVEGADFIDHVFTNVTGTLEHLQSSAGGYRSFTPCPDNWFTAYWEIIAVNGYEYAPVGPEA